MSPDRPDVDPHEFDTELAAVWYAANYYFETSFNARREFGGVVFRQPSGKYGFTVQRDGNADQIRYRGELAPRRAIMTAFWHTHVPKSGLYEAFLTLTTGETWRDLSTPSLFGGEGDTGLIDRLIRRAKEINYPYTNLAIYVVTDIQIQRYRPSAKKQIATWPKAMPSHLAQRVQQATAQ